MHAPKFLPSQTPGQSRDIEPVSKASAQSEAKRATLVRAVEPAIEYAQFRSAAEVARALGLSRARLSQVMRRRWATVAEQERILQGG